MLLRMSTTFLLFVDVLALYLSTLMGPAPVGSPGFVAPVVSQVYTFNVETENSTFSTGFLSADASMSTPCTLTQNSVEAPLQVGGLDSLDLYTVCSTSPQTSVLAKTSLLGSQTYTPLGYTSLFQNTTVSRLATDNGTNFYFLSRREGGNSSVWYTSTGRDIVSISDTQEDGWQLQHLALLGGQLFAIGNQLGNSARSILFWGRMPPVGKQPPQRYPGLAGNGPTLQTFAFSDPNTLWAVNGPSAAGGAGQLLLYIYNRQTLAWTVGAYYMFNTSFPVPTALFLGARPPIVKFHGVAPTQLMEFTIPIPTTGGSVSSALITRTLATAERGKQFRGLVASNWVFPSPSPSATWSTTATSSASSSGSSSSTTTASNSATTTSSSSSSLSPVSTESMSSSPTAISKGYSMSSSITPSKTSTSTSSPTATLSLGSSVSRTTSSSPSPTPTLTPTPTSTKSNTTVPDSPAAAAASGLTEGEKLSLGFGLTALIATVAGCVVLYGCYKSGKLFTLFLKKPPTTSKKPRHSSGQARNRPRKLAPVQLNINPAHLAKLNETRVSMRVAEEQTQIAEGGGYTIKTIKRTYAPMRIDTGGISTRTLSPLTNRMGTSV